MGESVLTIRMLGVVFQLIGAPGWCHGGAARAGRCNGLCMMTDPGNTPRSTAERVQIAIAIFGLTGVVATGIFANWDRIFPAPRPTAGIVGPVGDRVAVQNVYNLLEARGLDILKKQGFVNLRVLNVCSNSVAPGRIREVLLDNDANVADETSLVNELGSTGIEISLATKLAVKISNGPC